MVRVSLFVTCVVDQVFPNVGMAMAEVLERAGCEVEFREAQTCCAQPAFNSGYRDEARAVAEHFLKTFEGAEYIVVPSGSCGGMLAKHMPHLFDDDPNLRAKADQLAAKTYELTSFLVDVMKFTPTPPPLPVTATYHDSCAGLRELGVKAQPRALLSTVPGLTLTEMTEPEICCGFGGTFCVKYPDISTRMVTEKAADIEATQAELLLAGDMGCLLNMAGRLSREGAPVEVRHVAEVLAGMTRDTPAIGKPG